MAHSTTFRARAPRRPPGLALAAAVLLWAAIPAAFAQERILFPAVDDAQREILNLIRNEQVRLDVGMWLLGDGEIVQAIINKHNSGVPVRVLGDRASIFESDPNTRAAFVQLANAGVPIRLRYEPTWFPETMHWKAGIFVGQGVVEFGSANWTTFELVPWSPDNFKDETAMFTDDPEIFRAFLTRFDRFWVDTQYFRDWDEVWQAETGQAWTVPMTISRTRLEPDYPTSPPGTVWGQGSELNNPMIAEINRETERIDMVSYRLTVPNITDALIARHQAGVDVRVFIEPTQYRNPAFPEYWLVGSMADKLWAAGIPIKIRTHAGLTHMKTLITSHTALVASANFTRFWQRDHNYFISATGKPALYQAMRDRFDEMWNDTANYTTFTPGHPDAVKLRAPANGSAGVANPPRLEWQRAPWAVAFDVYVGTSQSNLSFAGRVNAQVDETPPETYAFTPAALQPNTTYFWRVVSRTYATDVNPSLTATSQTWSFTTGGSGGGGTSGPFNGTPAALPGTLQMENFDTGGAGVAYSDTTSGNSGGAYRSTDVDIEPTSDSGGGHNVGWTQPGEWLKYTVNVSTAGTYTLEFRVAASAAGGTFHVEVNGVDRTGPLTVPNTGGWQVWTTVTKTGVSLPAGQQVWRIVFDALGPGGVLGNFNYVRVVSGSSGGGGTSTPFGGTPVSLPGTIQAENYDEGGAGVAYMDTTSGNAGGVYRSNDVDIEATSDAGGGYNIGWTAVGEWLQYTVNVAAAGTYTLEFRVAARAPGGTFHLEVNGVDKTGPLTVPDTGSYQTWATVTKTGVSLSAGQQRWRLVIDAAGTVVGNFNYIRVTSGSSGGGGTTTPFGGTPVSLPGTIQSENYDEGGAGVAYMDTTSGNAGGVYRSGDVDLEATADAGGGYNIGWTAAGEWLKYTVNVTAAGTYTLEFRVAARAPGATFHLEVNGVDKTGPLTVPNTGSYQTWATVRKTGVSLSAGQQVWRLVIDAAGTVAGNFNSIRVVSESSGGGTSTPFGGAPAAVPGTIEAEHFDEGGEGVAYHDISPTNRGGQYRDTAVDLEASFDTGGGYALSYARAGEWLNYTASVSAPGTYALDVRVASNGQGGTFHIEANGIDRTGPIAIPNTGGWWTWTTIRKTGVTLGAGPQVLRLVMDANGATTFVGNINWFRFSSSASGAVTLEREPYLQSVRPDEATIVWTSREPGAGAVRYTGPSGTTLTAPASTRLFSTAVTGLSHDFYQHEALLTALAAGTRYTYDVLVGGVDATAGQDAFRTAPVEGGGRVRVLAFGDSGVGSAAQWQLAAVMAADSVDLALHTGDVAYGNADMQGGGSYVQYDEWFFGVYASWLRSTPFYPSIGNHDDERQRAQAWRDVFVLPEHGASPAYPDHAERFYSFDAGPVHFVALDTETAFSDPARRQAQIAWLEADLAATAQPWRIVYFHRSPYTAGSGHGSDLAVRAAFVPIFERYGVQLVISGHEHTYERSIPWREFVSGGTAVTYVVTGGGGAALYPVGRAPWTAVSASRHHYVRVEVEGCALTGEAVGVDGSVFDRFEIRRCD